MLAYTTAGYAFNSFRSSGGSFRSNSITRSTTISRSSTSTSSFSTPSSNHISGSFTSTKTTNPAGTTNVKVSNGNFTSSVKGNMEYTITSRGTTFGSSTDNRTIVVNNHTYANYGNGYSGSGPDWVTPMILVSILNNHDRTPAEEDRINYMYDNYSDSICNDNMTRAQCLKTISGASIGKLKAIDDARNKHQLAIIMIVIGSMIAIAFVIGFIIALKDKIRFH
jgi:hypothetical protein